MVRGSVPGGHNPSGWAGLHFWSWRHWRQAQRGGISSSEKTWICHSSFQQSQKNHGSVVALLPGKFLQIRKVFASKHLLAQKRPVGKEIVRIVRKLSGQSKNCPDNLETVRIIQKLSRQSKNCPDNLQTVRIIQKLSRQSKNCPDNLETVRII